MNDLKPFDYLHGQYDRLVPNPMPEEWKATNSLARIRLPFGGDGWLAWRHEHARAVLVHPGFSRSAGLNKDVPRATERLNSLLNLPLMDPPMHTRHRKLITKSFSRSSVELLRPRIEQIVAELVDKLLEVGPPGDLVIDLAWPLPSLVISEMLGVPHEDQDTFRNWTDASISVGAHTVEESEQAMINLVTYMDGLTAQRRENPQDDMITKLVNATDDEGPLSAQEVAMLGVVLLIGGYETTANMFGNMIYTLLTNPGELAKLRADPGLTASAVDEMLRHIPLANAAGIPLIATEDIEIGGTLVKSGEVVFIGFTEANRDPEVFSNPDVLDITRNSNSHMAFGHGVHRCIGSQLTRLELIAALDSVLSRMPDLAFAIPEPELPWKQGRAFRTLENLPVTWSQP